MRADRPIPHAVAMPTRGDPHVTVTFGSLPTWLDELRTEQRTLWLGGASDIGGASGLRGWILREGAFFQIEYDDGTMFVLDRAGQEVWVSWPAPLTLEDATTYLLGPVLGFLLRLRGLVCLHASAFVVGREAVALVGGAGHGKSTTVAAFAQRGFPVLSDDVVALREEGDRFHVVPSYPQLRLWPDSATFLFGSPDALERITPTHPTWDKRYVDLTADGFTFARDTVPLAAVYVLQPRQAGPMTPSVAELPPRARFSALFDNTYAAQYVDSVAHAQAFRVLARIASTVPVRAVTPHDDPARIGRLCGAILDDFAQHTSPPPLPAQR